jgi:hypothetical protein
VPGDVSGSSSLAMSMSRVVNQLKRWIHAVTANGVHWGSHSALVAIVSHFSELDADLVVLESGHNAGLTEGEVENLWSRVRAATDLLVSLVPLQLLITLLTAWGSSGDGLCR